MEYTASKSGKLIFARLVEDEDLLETITMVAKRARVCLGFFFLIGTLKKANLGFFREGKYETIEMNQPLEIISCLGNISLKENKIFAHAHIAVSDEKGKVFGGHVMPRCLIGATGELVLMEAEGAKLFRKLDKKTNLHLWSMNESSLKAAKKRAGST